MPGPAAEVRTQSILCRPSVDLRPSPLPKGIDSETVQGISPWLNWNTPIAVRSVVIGCERHSTP